MIEKIAIGGALWAALQFSVADQASEQGKAALELSEKVAQLEVETKCSQAKAYGLEDLRRAGLVIDCK